MQILKEIGKLTEKQETQQRTAAPTSPQCPKELGRSRESPLGTAPNFSPFLLSYFATLCTEERSLCIKYEELKMGESLGKGFFGEVRRAHWRSTDVGT